MPLTTYYYKHAVSAFFEMPRENAREILPGHLQPVEIRHGQSVLSVTAFEFSDSMVGPYKEVFLGIIVPPLVRQTEVMPKSAFFPFILATTTEASRTHAIERWHLPHYMKDVSIDFKASPERIEVVAKEGDVPIIDLVVTPHAWTKAGNLYQSFMADGSQRFKVNVRMNGPFTQHEEETGEITLHPHPFCERLATDEIASYPFRELWMKDGVQIFEELETI